MSWLALTLIVTDTIEVPIDINFRWVVSVRRTDDGKLTQLRVNGTVPPGDNLIYLVKETPEQIWDAWVKLQNVPPQRCENLLAPAEGPPVRSPRQRKDGSISKTTLVKPKVAA